VLFRSRALLLAGVSHDLRTPLTRMRLSTELMADVEPELTEGMIRDIEDMDAILDQFMAYIRDGSAEPIEPCDLNELISEVVAPLNMTEQRVALYLQPLPELALRRLSVKRMLTNLVENALNYGVEGVEVTSHLERSSIQPCVVVSVLDRGPGVDQSKGQDLFTPFIRGDRARSTKGTGLGLAIVKRIADGHGIRVQLLNRTGGGTEARLSFPVPSHRAAACASACSMAARSGISRERSSSARLTTWLTKPLPPATVPISPRRTRRERGMPATRRAMKRNRSSPPTALIISMRGATSGVSGGWPSSCAASASGMR